MEDENYKLPSAVSRAFARRFDLAGPDPLIREVPQASLLEAQADRGPGSSPIGWFESPDGDVVVVTDAQVDAELRRRMERGPGVSEEEAPRPRPGVPTTEDLLRAAYHKARQVLWDADRGRVPAKDALAVLAQILEEVDVE